MVEFDLWKGFTEHLQYMGFIISRHRLYESAGKSLDKGSLSGWKELNRQANRLKFQFDKSQLTIQYGVCLNRNGKFSQPVTFVPNTYQADTQHCFVNRKKLL